MARLTILALITALFGTASLYAQDNLDFRRLTVTYDAVVTNEIAETIKVRQADGSLQTYSGPQPSEFPYAKGDQFKLSFSVLAPTQEFFSSRPPRDNGNIVRIPLQPQLGGIDGNTIGLIGPLNVSEPASLTSTVFGQSTIFRGGELIYDIANDQYSFDFSGSWSLGPLDGPSFRYDPATNILTPGGNSNADNESGFRFQGTNTSATAQVPIWTPEELDLTRPPDRVGVFDLLLSGIWSFAGGPGGGSSGGGPVDVPAPSMLLLFGGAVGGIVWRRRGALQAA